MLNKANITWSAKQITKMVANEVLRFDNIIQRSYVWEQVRKSDLIHSMMEGYPIPPFYARKVDGKIYDFLDGKQRMDAITGYISDAYELKGIDLVELDDTMIDVNGKKFSELPEDLQDRIKDYSLTIYYYEAITPEQVRTMFRKLNNGKPLSAKERNIANCVDIIRVSDIGNHELFQKILTEKGRDARKQLPIVMKIWTMLNEEVDSISFDSKNFNEIMQQTRIADDEKERIVAILDKILNVYNLLEEEKRTERKKMVNETHLVSLIPFFEKAVDEGIEDKLMADFIVSIFNGNDVVVSDKYKEASRSGSARNASIVIRHNELQKAWGAFFTEDMNVIDEYKYGMRLRGYAPMCQPKDGFIRREDSDKYYDIIVYNRELTQEELNQYELDVVVE